MHLFPKMYRNFRALGHKPDVKIIHKKMRIPVYKFGTASPTKMDFKLCNSIHQITLYKKGTPDYNKTTDQHFRRKKN